MLFFRFIKELLLPGQVTGPQTFRRLALLSLFLPTFFLLQAVHWLCFVLDELLFPGYRKVQVWEPLFVVGLPRSGTSFLQRVLARDTDRFTTTRLWELLFAPSILQRKIILALATLDRLLGRPLGRLFRRAEKGGFRWMEAVHQVSFSDPEEDYFLLLPAFACFLLVVPFPYQDTLWELSRFDLLEPAKRKPLMTFYYRAVQKHLYLAGPGKRLLSKNPSFTPFIRSLQETFPDARFLCCTREPKKVVPSLLSSIRSGAELFGYDVAEPRIRDRYVEMLSFFSRHAPSALSSLPPDHHAFVPLPALKDDLEGFVLGIYQRFGWTPQGGFRERLQEEASRSRAYTSDHHYTLEEFGLSPEDLEGRFDTLPLEFDPQGEVAP